MSTEPLTVTPASRIAVPTEDVVLSHTKDMDGNAVVVRVKRLQRSDILLMLGAHPMLVPKKDAKKAADDAKAALESDPFSKENVERVREAEALAAEAIVRGCVSPRFVAGDSDGESVGTSVLHDDDKELLVERIFRLSGFDISASDGALANFPVERQKGRGRRQ